MFPPDENTPPEPPHPGVGAAGAGPLLTGDGFDRERSIDWFQDRLADVCGHLHALHARLVVLTAEALEHGWWEQSGVKTPEHWLCWQTGLSAAHARQVVAAARRHTELPVTMAAFAAGELSLDQINPIVARAPEWADREVCALAKQCTVSQIRSSIGRYPFPASPTTPDAVQPAVPGDITAGDRPDPHPDDPVAEAVPTVDEFWSFIQTDNGTWRLAGRFDADHGLVIDAALREVADALLRESGESPSGVDVLCEMARRSLGTVADTTRRDRFKVHVLLDEYRQLLDPFGHCLPDWIRDLITCDTAMAVTWTRNGRPIAQGSTSDTIAPAVRRHVLARDGGCRVPGCGLTRRLDLHHVIHRAHGGTNDPWNLISLCPKHHRLHHRGLLGISGNPEDSTTSEALKFTDPFGRPLRPNTLIRPPTGPPPPPTGTYQHPLGERLDLRWVEFSPPPAQQAANGPNPSQN